MVLPYFRYLATLQFITPISRMGAHSPLLSPSWEFSWTATPPKCLQLTTRLHGVNAEDPHCRFYQRQMLTPPPKSQDIRIIIDVILISERLCSGAN